MFALFKYFKILQKYSSTHANGSRFPKFEYNYDSQGSQLTFIVQLKGNPTLKHSYFVKDSVKFRCNNNMVGNVCCF